MTVRFEFKPQDCWVGAFWRTSDGHSERGFPGKWINLWVCLVPMLPIHFIWFREVAPWSKEVTA